MKATINENGFLCINPESEIEHYALKTWWSTYTKTGIASIKVDLKEDLEKIEKDKIERPLTIGALTAFLEAGIKCEIAMREKQATLFRLEALSAIGEFDVKFKIYESENNGCVIFDPTRE